jgi:ubiquinone/menaquinone biosynthesis C-methylase UbiE
MNSKFDWHKETEKQWDQRASYWNENSQSMWDKGSRKSIIPFLKQYLSEGSKVTDIGCGDGYGSYKLYKEGFEVVGVDISNEMIARAKEREVPDELTFTQGDIKELPFGDNTFDAIMAINSLEWTKLPSQSLQELTRILKPNGILCIGILGPTAMPRVNSYPRLYGEEVICNTMMPWEFRKLAEQTGYRILDGQGVYKKEVKMQHKEGLPEELLQALSFMWIYILKK